MGELLRAECGELERVDEGVDESLTGLDTGTRGFDGLIAFELSELVEDREGGLGYKGRRTTLDLRARVSLCDRVWGLFRPVATDCDNLAGVCGGFSVACRLITTASAVGSEGLRACAVVIPCPTPVAE